MLRILLLAGCVAVVLGGKSPHADYVNELFARNPSARYSSDIHEDARLDVVSLFYFLKLFVSSWVWKDNDKKVFSEQKPGLRLLFLVY